MKSLLIRLLCLLLAFTLASCGEIVGSPEPPVNTPPADTPTEPPTNPEGYTFTVTLRYNGAPFLPEDTVTVEWTDGQSIHRADVDAEGRATVQGLDGDYRISLHTLPEGYTYDPNIYTATNASPDVTVELYKLSEPRRDSGNGKDFFKSPVILTKTGYYRATVTKANQKIFFRFHPPTSGRYVFTSLVNATKDNVNPILYYYEGASFAYLPENPTVVDGGAEGFTSNFVFEALVDNDNLAEDGSGGMVVGFAIAADATDGSYPIEIDFHIEYKSDWEAGSLDTELVVPKELDKIRGNHNYDKSEYTFLDAYMVINGQRIYEDDYFRLNPETGFYHLYDEEVYAATNGYGPILYANLTVPTIFTDASFTTIELAGNTALTVFYDGMKHDYKLFIEGIGPLLVDPGANDPTATVGPYLCNRNCPCRKSGACIGACLLGCSRCLDECRQVPEGGLDCVGYAGKVNLDGRVPVTEELKTFLQYFAITQSYFIDGGGWAETQADPPYHAGEDDQWLFACGYYLPK